MNLNDKKTAIKKLYGSANDELIDLALDFVESLDLFYGMDSKDVFECFKNENDFKLEKQAFLSLFPDDELGKLNWKDLR